MALARFGRRFEVGFGVFARISKTEGTEPLLEPRVQALAATIQQLRETHIGQTFEMIGMSHRGAAERVPHIREIAIFEALKARVSHVPGKCNACAALASTPSPLKH